MKRGTSGRVKPPDEHNTKRQKLPETHDVDRVSGSPLVTSPSALPHTSPRHPSPESASDLEFMEWACATCTYVNHPQRVTCEMCFSKKRPRTCAVPPPSSASGLAAPKTDLEAKSKAKLEQEPGQDAWDCLMCGERGMPHEFWTCKFCGQVKLSS